MMSADRLTRSTSPRRTLRNTLHLFSLSPLYILRLPLFNHTQPLLFHNPPLYLRLPQTCSAPTPPAAPSPPSPAWQRRRASPSRPQRLPRRSPVPSRLTAPLARSVCSTCLLSHSHYINADLTCLQQSTPTARSAAPRRRSAAHSPPTDRSASSVCIPRSPFLLGRLQNACADLCLRIVTKDGAIGGTGQKAAEKGQEKAHEAEKKA